MLAFRHLRHAPRAPSLAAAALLAATAAACAPTPTPPQEVEADPPKVSYTYASDTDLIKANNKAQTYCSQYHSVPSMDGTIGTNPDGTKTVTFRCVQSAAVPPTPVVQPMTYTYRSDGELLRALQAAETYCGRNGQGMSSNIDTNPDGSKRLSFRCVPS